MIRSMTSTAVQNFVDIRPWGASGQIGEILTVFRLLFIHFLSNAPTGHTADHIFTLNGSNDADSRKGVPILVWLILQTIYGIKLPKNQNFWDVNRDFPAKRAKY